MKIIQVKSLISICVFLLIAGTLKVNASFKANEDPVERKKTITRSFNVTGSDKLSVENSFGNVEIKTWDKNEFKVDITVTVKTDDDAGAQRLLDAIEIKEKHSAGIYSFHTDTGNTNEDSRRSRNYRGRDSKEFHVDYIVFMPAGNPLFVENSFGNLDVADFDGKATIISKYGTLNTGKIADNGGISAEYSNKVTIASVKGGKTVFQYCGSVNIKNLSGDVKVVTEYSHGAFTLNNSLTGLNLITSYSSVLINMPPGLAVAVSADCSFCSCINKTGLPLKLITDEDNRYSMNRHYEGASGDGSIKVKIKSNYGNILITNP